MTETEVYSTEESDAAGEPSADIEVEVGSGDIPWMPALSRKRTTTHPPATFDEVLHGVKHDESQITETKSKSASKTAKETSRQPFRHSRR